MRRFEKIFDTDEESDGFLSIDEAVIVAEGEIHHRADDDLAVEGYGAFLNGVHSEDSTLGRVQDGSAEEGAVNATVGDGEDATGEILDGDFPGLAFDCIVNDVLLDGCEGFFVAITEHWDDETLLGADGDSDIVEIVFNDISPIDAPVDGWDIFESLGNGFYEEGHEA